MKIDFKKCKTKKGLAKKAICYKKNIDEIRKRAEPYVFLLSAITSL